MSVISETPIMEYALQLSIDPVQDAEAVKGVEVEFNIDDISCNIITEFIIYMKIETQMRKKK